MSEVALVNTNGSVQRAASPNAGVTRAEHERRLYFVADKLLDGLPRRLLVEMATSCFRVSARTARKYVAVAEQRLRRHEAITPLFYYNLSRLQRDKLLQMLMSHGDDEKLDTKSLIELVTAAYKLLDSRDAVARSLFQAQGGEKKIAQAAGRVESEVETAEVDDVQELMREPDMLQIELQPDERGERSAPRASIGTAPVPRLSAPGDSPDRTGQTPDEDTDDEDEDGDADMDISQLPPEVMARMFKYFQEGLTEEEAAEKAFREDFPLGGARKAFQDSGLGL